MSHVAENRLDRLSKCHWCLTPMALAKFIPLSAVGNRRSLACGASVFLRIVDPIGVARNLFRVRALAASLRYVAMRVATLNPK